MKLLVLFFLVVYIRSWGVVVLDYMNTTSCDNTPVTGGYAALDRCIPMEEPGQKKYKGYRIVQKDMDTGVPIACDDVNCTTNCQEDMEFKIFRCSSADKGSAFVTVIEDPFPWMKAYTDMCNEHYPGKCRTVIIYSQPNCLGEILAINVQVVDDCKNQCQTFDNWSFKINCDHQ